MPKYNPQKIEKKWQKFWAKHPELYSAKEKGGGKKAYILDMFPYPSADGLHTGHIESYTATDIISRYLRMKGKNVLHPQGFDAFGLPAENFAVKTRTHPAITTQRAISNFRQQMQMMGLSYDWSRMVDSSDPEYYKWTQWFFLLLYKHGLAYKTKAKANWCPSCQTVLANEQAEGGACERCGSQVIQKDLEQWFFKITDFIEDKVGTGGRKTNGLISGLDKIDWPDSTKTAQRNWVGKSEGAQFKMKIEGSGVLRARYDKILLATNNLSKKARVEKLLEAIGVRTKILIPKDLGLEAIEAKEEGDLFENAKEKAELYREKTDLPVLGIDSGFFMQGERIDPIKVKRNALGGENEKELNQPEIGKLIHEYYKSIVRKRGGKIDAYWHDVAVVSLPDGTIQWADDKRDVIITDQVRGEIDIYFPLRSLYISKVTGKYIADQTKEDGLLEQEPFIQTLKKLLCEEELILEVFTTRLDTVFGMTYAVIAPEHSIIVKLKSYVKNWDEVEKYLDAAKKKSELQRLIGLEKVPPQSGEDAQNSNSAFGGENFGNKTGVELKGVRAVNPFNNQEIPIFVADYVLAHYGTGAVMAVPAHDQRDFEFAKKYGLPIVEVIKSLGVAERSSASVKETMLKREAPLRSVSLLQEAFREDGILVNSDRYNGLTSAQAREKMAAWLEKEGMGKKTINYKIRDWLVSRQRYWGAPIPIIYCSNCHSRPASRCGVNSSENPENNKSGSRIKSGMTDRRTAVIDGEKYAMIPVPEKDLPVKLPDDVDFMPTGESPLQRSEKFHNVKCPVCGAKARRESDTMDTFVCSSWYYFRYADPRNKKEFASKKQIKKWLPVDLYVGGAEHTVLHLLYSRFFTKALHNLGYIDFDEPFSKMRHQGIIVAEDGRKMSKSFGNVVNPNDVVARFGADALRLLEMFMGPLEDSKKWDAKGIMGVYRFLEKTWDCIFRNYVGLFFSDEDRADWINGKFQGDTQIEVKILLNKTIKKVTEDIENLRFNTAISQLMILRNSFFRTEKTEQHLVGNTKVEVGGISGCIINKSDFKKFLILLAPFAPHIAEELWAQLGSKKSIFTEKWPGYDAELVKEEVIELVVQINGKVRDKIQVSAGISENEARKAALESGKIKQWLAGQEPKKVIFVKGKLVNIVL